MSTVEVGQLYVRKNGRYAGRKVEVVARARARHWHIETIETGRRNMTSAKSLLDASQWVLVIE